MNGDALVCTHEASLGDLEVTITKVPSRKRQVLLRLATQSSLLGVIMLSLVRRGWGGEEWEEAISDSHPLLLRVAAAARGGRFP